MNDVREFSVPPAQLSCLIGNLFAELEPPCGVEASSIYKEDIDEIKGVLAEIWRLQRLSLLKAL